LSDIKSETITTSTENIDKPLTQAEKENLQFQKLLQFANLAKYITKDLNSVNQPTSTYNKNYEKSEIISWLANPQKYEKKLRDLSRFLLNSSSHYRRLIDYFATMLTFDYVVDIYNQTEYKLNKKMIDTVQEKYVNTINFLETMNLKHEFSKLIYRAMIDDVAYGYEYSLKNSFFFDILNPDYCSISSIEDGVYNYSFSFDYFDRYPKELDRFADEFKEKYEIYKADKRNKKWQELDSSKTICIKISDTEHTIPPLAGIFEEIYTLYTYKDMQMSKTELENYLLLVATIPYQKDAKDHENAFALSLDIAKEYFGLMSDSLPSQIGAILSPFEKVEPIKLNKSEKELDTVTLAENSIYNAAGVPRLIFNSDKASGAALNKAILNDQTTMFRTLRQFERWINRRLKDENKKTYFKVSFLDITKYNQDDMVKAYKEASTVGLPVKTRYCAALGLSPSDMMNSMMLENDVLDIVNKFKPLSTSYTEVGNNKGGKPSNGENKIDDSGQKTIDNDSNNPENRT
jgi:hypothetical protein